MVVTGAASTLLALVATLQVAISGGTRVWGSDQAQETASASASHATPGTPSGSRCVYDGTAPDPSSQYNGRVYDPGTGFHDYGARMYWPQTGRFISADSYQGDLANPASLNRYSYVLNNPYKYVDPTGHWDERVHKTRTKVWAIEAGMDPADATVVGEADNATDQGATGPLPNGDPSRHFDTTEGPGADTRMQNFEADLATAVALERASLDTGDFLLSNGLHGEALKLLGRALHSLQDVDAHCAPYVRRDPVGGWYEHASPENVFYRGRNDADDPDTRPERLAQTERGTKGAVKRFQEQSKKKESSQ